MKRLVFNVRRTLLVQVMGKGETGGTYSTHWNCEKFMQNSQSLNLHHVGDKYEKNML